MPWLAAALLASVLSQGAGAASVIPAQIQVQPAQTRAHIGEPVRFEATAMGPDQRPMDFQPLWRTEAGASITSDGVFIAQRPGRFTVTAQHASGRAIGTATVVVDMKPQRAARLELVPREVVVTPGEFVQFRATLRDRQGGALDFTPRWRATSGRVSQRGVWRAGNRPGVYRVTVRDPRSGLEATALTRISAP